MILRCYRSFEGKAAVAAEGYKGRVYACNVAYMYAYAVKKTHATKLHKDWIDASGKKLRILAYQ